MARGFVKTLIAFFPGIDRLSPSLLPPHSLGPVDELACFSYDMHTRAHPFSLTTSATHTPCTGTTDTQMEPWYYQ
jgi:hypothetical protein